MKVFDHKHGLEVNVNRLLEDIWPEIVEGREVYRMCSMKRTLCTDEKYFGKCPNYIEYSRKVTKGL